MCFVKWLNLAAADSQDHSMNAWAALNGTSSVNEEDNKSEFR